MSLQHQMSLVQDQGFKYLDYQCDVIMQVNHWRAGVFIVLQLDIQDYQAKLQEDISAIKKSLVLPQNGNDLTSFILKQMKTMDKLKHEFKQFQTTLNQFIKLFKNSLPNNLLNDLVNNTRILTDYFHYDPLSDQQKQPILKNLQFGEQHSQEINKNNNNNIECILIHEDDAQDTTLETHSSCQINFPSEFLPFSEEQTFENSPEFFNDFNREENKDNREGNNCFIPDSFNLDGSDSHYF